MKNAVVRGSSQIFNSFLLDRHKGGVGFCWVCLWEGEKGRLWSLKRRFLASHSDRDTMKEVREEEGEREKERERKRERESVRVRRTHNVLMSLALLIRFQVFSCARTCVWKSKWSSNTHSHINTQTRAWMGGCVYVRERKRERECVGVRNPVPLFKLQQFPNSSNNDGSRKKAEERHNRRRVEFRGRLSWFNLSLLKIWVKCKKSFVLNFRSNFFSSCNNCCCRKEFFCRNEVERSGPDWWQVDKILPSWKHLWLQRF